MVNLRSETPMELFKSLIDTATAELAVPPSEDCACYLVQLLDACIRPEHLYARAGIDPGRPLAEIFCAALTAGGAQRLALLRLTGDLSLFTAGFQAESLGPRKPPADYYATLGGTAYHTLSDEGGGAKALFDELADHFIQWADLLATVAEQCNVLQDADLLRLYARWTTTGSPRAAAVLRRHGIPLTGLAEASVN